MKFKFVDDNEEIIFHMYDTAKNDTMWDMYFSIFLDTLLIMLKLQNQSIKKLTKRLLKKIWDLFNQ